MHTLPVHPSGLMYSQIFLRLEPLGVERVAAVAEVASIREPGVSAAGENSPGRTSVTSPRRIWPTARRYRPDRFAACGVRAPAWAPGHPRAGGLAMAAAGFLVGLRLARQHRPDRNLDVSYDRR